MEPGYQHDDVIFVDPDVEARHGKDVLARLGGSDEAVFRHFVVEGALQYLRPLNRHWPDKIIEITAYPRARIIGTIIGKWVQR